MDRSAEASASELSEVLDRVSDAVYGLDSEWRFTYVNDRAASLLGFAEEELRGEALWDVFPETVDSAIHDQFKEAVETQEPVSFDQYFDPLDIWVEVQAYPSETGLTVYFQDVSERKEREHELERYERIVETVGDAIYVVDEEQRFTMVNPAAEELSGYSREQLVDMHVADVIGEKAAAKANELGRALSSEDREVVSAEFTLSTADGRDVPIDVRFAPLPTADGSAKRVGVARNISEQKARERVLEENEQLYRSLAENFPNGVVGVYNDDLRYTLAAGEKIGDPAPSREEVEGTRMPDLYPDDAVADLEPLFRAAIEDGETNSVQTEVVGRHWQVWATPLRNADGEIFAGLSFAQDITEQIERERELERYETIVETVNDGVYVVDEDGTFQMVNETYAEMLGYPPDELVGTTAATVVEGDDVQEQVEELHAATTEGDVEHPSMEGALRTASGEKLPVEATFAPLPGDESDWHRVGVVRDISERKERERALEESERRYRTLVEHFPNGAVGLFDENLEYTAVGGELLDTTGVKPKDRIGDSVYDIYPDELVEEVEPYFQAALNGEANSFEAEYHSRHLYAHTLPIRNADDEVFAGMLVVQDVTERREYERMLEESNERLEQFAYAASHDLQEPLRMVSSYLQLIEDRYTDELGDDGQEFLAFAVDGADRMREMIEGLLQYSRIETQGDEFDVVDLEAVLEDTQENLQMKIEEYDAEITTGSLPRVEGDEGQLHQVFQNLLSNAIEYSGDEPPQVDVSAERNEREVTVTVTDEGIGIDPDDQDRIFEVFQRIQGKSNKSGSGIGLALCERIVERHGGEIWVDSEPGEGATFSFTLPAVREGFDD